MDWKFLFTSYEGRINRAKFWAGVGVFFVGAIIAMILDNLLGTTIDQLPYGVIYIIYALASIYFIFAVYAKRWHDRNKSAWWILIGLVPLVGAIWFIVECGCLAGTKGPNNYGPDPLA